MQPISVSQLNLQIKNLLEQDVGEVYVAGEISNLSKPASGHFYFTMKDSRAQIRCVFFKNRHVKLDFALTNGQQVSAYGRLSLYEARGDYQLIIEKITEDGLGDLHKLFELLKVKLRDLGWFDISRKKALPKFPNCIGVITSSSGAALKDILITLERRFPCARVIVYPSEVQGKGAAQQLITAILSANADMRAEVLILARGGGSFEDLWSFNDEKLANIIVSSKIPIVSGVGHEVDFTIADFVADLRAATPTAAAEAVTPNKSDLLVYLNIICNKLVNAINGELQKKVLLLAHKVEKLSVRGQIISTYWQKLDYLEIGLVATTSKILFLNQHKLEIVLASLLAQNPKLLLARVRTELTQLEDRLWQVIRDHIQDLNQKFKSLLVTLNAVSPLATLDRGYALVMHENKLVFSGADVAIGSEVEIRLANGRLVCEVLENAKN